MYNFKWLLNCLSCISRFKVGFFYKALEHHLLYCDVFIALWWPDLQKAPMAQTELLHKSNIPTIKRDDIIIAMAVYSN